MARFRAPEDALRQAAEAETKSSELTKSRPSLSESKSRNTDCSCSSLIFDNDFRLTGEGWDHRTHVKEGLFSVWCYGHEITCRGQQLPMPQIQADHRMKYRPHLISPVRILKLDHSHECRRARNAPCAPPPTLRRCSFVKRASGMQGLLPVGVSSIGFAR